MKVLVLGSDGQIGSPLTEYLQRQGNDVTEFDNLTNPITDLRIPHILDGILSEIDFVFFLAFDVGGSVYLKEHQNTYEFISNNIKIMNNTFDSLRKSGTPFIFASSQMSEMSSSTYGILKRIGEQYTKCLNGKILKFWNVYGFDQVEGRSWVIGDFIRMARKGHIDMKTNGEELRQFLFVMDCCKCMEEIMNHFDEIDERQFDVSSFKWTSIKGVAEIVASNFNNCPIFASDKTDDISRGMVKPPNRDILQYWEPETSIKDGIRKVILYETY
jgi:nucleoside-diphosphate-sugar epimerase